MQIFHLLKGYEESISPTTENISSGSAIGLGDGIDLSGTLLTLLKIRKTMRLHRKTEPNKTKT